ncbi:MAG: T9SS type A sorting domain-containing protein [Flavobacteriales bacterium]
MHIFTRLGLLFLLVSTLIPKAYQAQTELYFEDFNAATSTFTLNTSDVSSTATGSNIWVINNSYTGGSGSGNVICFGVPLPVNFTINNTPTQPGGITGGPTSGYLHTASNLAIGAGITNSSFQAADGLCTNPENIFACMSSQVSTVGFDNVNFTFWWVCNGSANNFGEVYYSTNGGTTWTLITTPIAQYNLTSQWQQQTISLPAFANQATLRFGFRFVNNTTSTASDPGFSIDDVRITASPLSNNTIATGTVPPGPHCPGATFQVPYTINGTFNAGNVFTAQLSDATGSFAAPVNIGTNASTTAGNITVTIPMGTPAGTQYRIRVVSNNPAVTGTDNGVNFTILGPPVAGTITANPLTVCPNGTTSLSITGQSGNIQWQQSDNGVNFNNIPGATNSTFTSGPLTQTTHFRAVISNACGSVETAAVIINIANAIQIDINMNPASGSLCSGQVQLSVTGNFSNFTWSNGQTGNAITVSQPGQYCGEGTDVSGCPVVANCVTVTPGNPQPISITPPGDVIICNGNLTLSATPGFVNYLWSNGATGSSVVVTEPGNYTVTGTDADGCTSTSEPVNAQVGNTVVLNVNPPNPAICSGQPVTLTAAPGFSSYEWSNGQVGASITVSQPGIYTVTAVDPGGCNGVSPPISVSIGQNPISNFNYLQTGGFTANFNNTTQNANTFLWDFAGLGTSSANNPSFTFPSTGIYNVTLTSSNLCGTDDITKIVSISAVGIGELDNIAQIAVYPNPVSNFLNLVVEFDRPGNLLFEVYSISGKKLKAELFNGIGLQQHQINFIDLASGIYIIRFVSGNSVSHARIIKQ